MSKLPKGMKFEDAIRRLDSIVTAMEAGQIGIEEAIEKYEEAMLLKTHCQSILDQAEQRIKQIQFDAGGAARVSPFESPGESAAARDAE